MVQETYADGIGNIHVTGNIVRIDFIALQPHLKADNGQPVYDLTQRVVMPLEGFINAFGVQNDLVKKLVDAGVITIPSAPPASKPAAEENESN